jgi:hypothetical protein
MYTGRFSNFFRSLRFRLAAWNTAVVLSTVAISLLLVRQGLEYTLLQEIDGVLLDETIELGLAVDAMNIDSDAIHREMDRKALAHRGHGWFVQLIAPGDKPLWTSGEVPPEESHIELPAHSPAVLTVGHHRVAQRRFEPPGKPAYWVRVAASLDASIDAPRSPPWWAWSSWSSLPWAATGWRAAPRSPWRRSSRRRPGCGPATCASGCACAARETNWISSR